MHHGDMSRQARYAIKLSKNSVLIDTLDLTSSDGLGKFRGLLFSWEKIATNGKIKTMEGKAKVAHAPASVPQR